MKIALYIGRFRFPLKPSDIGIEFFDAIRNSKHEICAFLVESDDPLLSVAMRQGINVITLPQEMLAPVAKMRKYFTSPPFCENVETFLSRIHDADPDIGVVYCGAWIPPALRVAIPMGFINLHPGPLPELSGYDPEKFMILGDFPTGHGTVHRTADLFDTGNILAFTPPVPLPRYTTTPELAQLITRSGFKTVLDVLDNITGPRFSFGTPQDESRRGYATRKRGYIESVLRLEEDSHRKLNSRLRAFNSLDDGMPLKLFHENKYTIIFDLETHDGSFPGNPGDKIGRYSGPGMFFDASIFRTCEGSAVLLPGSTVDSHDTAFILPEERLIPSGERPLRTSTDHFDITER